MDGTYDVNYKMSNHFLYDNEDVSQQKKTIKTTTTAITQLTSQLNS